MIKCPIVNKDIEITDCCLVVDVCIGAVKESALTNEFKSKDNWQEICSSCKYHNN